MFNRNTIQENILRRLQMAFNKDKEFSAKRKDQKTFIDDILDFTRVFVISAVVILLFTNFIAHPVNIVGHSMDPTLNNGEFGFTSLISTALSKPDRFDVVVVNVNDGGQEERWVKRVIGLPNEKIECRDGVVYVNDKALDESAYLKEEFMNEMLAQFKAENGIDYGHFNMDFEPVQLGEDEYFVMGDNRPYSKDSRYVGPVNGDSFYGKGVLVLFPFDKIGVK